MSKWRLRIVLAICLVAVGLRALLPAQAEGQAVVARASLAGGYAGADRPGALLLNIARLRSGVFPAESAVGACDPVTRGKERGGPLYASIVENEKDFPARAIPPVFPILTSSLRPVAWTGLFDPGQTLSTKAPKTRNGYLTPQRPVGITLERSIPPEERLRNFEFLWNAIDESYAAFVLKGIDWKEIGRRYRERLVGVANDNEFYSLMFQLVNELRDSHSGIEDYAGPIVWGGTGLATDLFGGEAFVVGVRSGSDAANLGVRRGWQVIQVDGLTVPDRIEALRPFVRAHSSERGYRRDAARLITAGSKGSMAVVELRSLDGGTLTLRVQRDFDVGSGRVGRPPPFALTKQRFVHFGRHPSGVGYIRIESFNERTIIADEFDRALEALRDSPALILDIRDNPGGFGQPRIVGRFLSRRTLGSIAYVKSGSAHGDLRQRESYLQPTGSWQYASPVALLINQRTGSAADLFACELRSADRVVAIGERTEGNLSGLATYAVLPCGLVVRVSNAYVCDAKRRPIEGNGNPPDITVVPGISDFLNGVDPVLDAAVRVLLRQPE
jgi:carboxyl-terminal processing protease